MALNQTQIDKLEATNQDILLTDGHLVPYGPYIFDHFLGIATINSSVPQNWVTTETGTGTPFAVTSGGVGGHCVGVTGGTTNNGEELAGKNVCWNPSTMATGRKLVFEMRAKFVAATTATDGDMFFGLSDAVTETNSLPYVVGATSALTTHAPTDSALFAYSSIATSGALFLSGGNHFGFITSKADVDTVTAPSVSVVKDSSFHRFRIECDSSANCAFFIDGAHVGSVAAAFTANTAMTPYISIVAKNSHALTATIDYLYIGAGIV